MTERRLRTAGSRVSSSQSSSPPSTHQRIRAVVARIPRGRVATYGQIAALAGLAGQPRLVGYALHALPDGSSLPWQRVVNARGEVSRRSDPSGHENLQRAMLEKEGVRFDARGRLDLARFQWRPRSPLIPAQRRAKR